MRLTPQQINSITRTVSAHTAGRAHAYLFGSRLDDNKLIRSLNTTINPARNLVDRHSRARGNDGFYRPAP